MSEKANKRIPTWAKVVAAGTAVGMLTGGVKISGIDVPHFNIFGEGGKPEAAPHGSSIYEGQTPQTVSKRFLTQLGTGDGRVSVKIKQDWDRHGSILDGDWVPTNGTASVSGAKDRGKPALLHVTTRYCSDGIINRVPNPNSESNAPSYRIVYDMGKIGVCGADLLHSVVNDEQIHQDNTPPDFQAKFNTFVARGVEAQVKAAPCPTNELEKRYSSLDYLQYAQSVIANTEGVPLSDVTVKQGTIEYSSPAVQQELRHDLHNFETQRNPQNNKSYAAVDVQYFSENKAIEKSCFQEIGYMSFEDMQNFNASQHYTPSIAK